MEKADLFVIHDDAQFNKHEYQHRNRIRVEKGWQYLIVPIQKKEIPINQIEIKNHVQIGNRKWSLAHFDIIRDWYKKAPYFSNYEEDLFKIYEKEYEHLIDLNLALIYFIMKSFDLDRKIVFSSTFGFQSKRTERIIDTVRAVGGDTYLSGVGGQNYLDTALFTDITLEFQDFKHPVYPQCYPGFVPNMAAIDALFNVGAMPNGKE
jgi:hypothetical protein